MRWFAPSLGAACAGALAGGLFEGVFADGPVAIGATVGFIAMIALPILFIGSVTVRALIAAWRPGALIALATDDDGGAPRLAAWAAVVWLGVAALYWASFQATWLLAAWTAFKPLPIAFAEPVIAVVSTLGVILLARPAAQFLEFVARAVDKRWRRRFRTSLVTPPKVLAGTALVTLGVLGALWWFAMRPRIGPLDLSVLWAPLVAFVATCLYTLVPSVVGYIAGGLVAIAIGLAAYARLSEPTLTLEIWGDRPVAGLAIDQLFDLDDIRANVSMSAFRPTATPGSPHPDIVLITIDTVRADHTPPYGGHAEMPLLRELAARGVTFDWAFSPSNVTRRSIPSMVIGLAPNRVRGRVVGWALRIDPRHVVLAERLVAAGYETAGFMCCYGFWSPEVHTGLQRGLQHIEIEPNGLALGKKARAWLEKREASGDHKPLFVWMHVLEPHNWTAASGEPHNDDERRRFYDRSLQLSDAVMVEVLGAFAKRPPEQAPIVIVTADHGEGLGDHGQPYHSTDLYDSQTRVPLVMAGPGIHPGHIAETVSLTDLVPTIIELAGFAAPTDGSIDGRSIADLARGTRQPDWAGGIAFSAMIQDRSNPGGIIAITRGPWKLIDNDGHEELYNVRNDPDERSSLIMQSDTHQTVTQLRQLLKARVDLAKRSPFH